MCLCAIIPAYFDWELSRWLCRGRDLTETIQHLENFIEYENYDAENTDQSKLRYVLSCVGNCDDGYYVLIWYYGGAVGRAVELWVRDCTFDCSAALLCSNPGQVSTAVTTWDAKLALTVEVLSVIGLTIRAKMTGGRRPLLYLKFWVKLTALERNRRFSISYFRS